MPLREASLVYADEGEACADLRQGTGPNSSLLASESGWAASGRESVEDGESPACSSPLSRDSEETERRSSTATGDENGEDGAHSEREACEEGRTFCQERETRECISLFEVEVSQQMNSAASVPPNFATWTADQRGDLGGDPPGFEGEDSRSDCGSSGDSRRQSLVVIPLDEEEPHTAPEEHRQQAELRSRIDVAVRPTRSSSLPPPDSCPPRDVAPPSSDSSLPQAPEVSPPQPRLPSLPSACPPPLPSVSSVLRLSPGSSHPSAPVQELRSSAAATDTPAETGTWRQQLRAPSPVSSSASSPSLRAAGSAHQLPAAVGPSPDDGDFDTVSDWSMCRRPLGHPAKLFVNAGIPVSFIKGGGWGTSSPSPAMLSSQRAPRTPFPSTAADAPRGVGGPTGRRELRELPGTGDGIEVSPHRSFYLNAATVRAAAQADAALHAERTASRQSRAASVSAVGERPVGAHRRLSHFAGTAAGRAEPGTGPGASRERRDSADDVDEHPPRSAERRESSLLAILSHESETEGVHSEVGRVGCRTGNATSRTSSGPSQSPPAASAGTSGSGRRMLWFWGGRQRSAETQEEAAKPSASPASRGSAGGVARLLFGRSEEAKDEEASGLFAPARREGATHERGGLPFRGSGRDSTELERLLDSENEAALRQREMQETLHREDLEAMLKNVQQVKNFLVVKLRECEAALLATAKERNDLEESLRQLGSSLQEKEVQREEALQTLRREKEHQQVELESLRADVARIEARREELEVEVSQLRGEGTLLRAEIHDRMAANTLTTEKLQGTVNQLKSEKRVLVREIVSLRHSLAESRQELANALARLDELEAFVPQPPSSPADPSPSASALSSSSSFARILRRRARPAKAQAPSAPRCEPSSSPAALAEKKPRRSTSAGSGRGSPQTPGEEDRGFESTDELATAATRLESLSVCKRQTPCTDSGESSSRGACSRRPRSASDTANSSSAPASFAFLEQQSAAVGLSLILASPRRNSDAEHSGESESADGARRSQDCGGRAQGPRASVGSSPSRGEKATREQGGWIRTENVAGRVGGALAAGMSRVLRQLENVLTVEETLIVDASGVYTEDGVCVESLEHAFSLGKSDPQAPASLRLAAPASDPFNRGRRVAEAAENGGSALPSHRSPCCAPPVSRGREDVRGEGSSSALGGDAGKASDAFLRSVGVARQKDAHERESREAGLPDRDARDGRTGGSAPPPSSEHERIQKPWSGRGYQWKREDSTSETRAGNNGFGAGDLVVVLSDSEEAAEAATRKCLHGDGTVFTQALWPKKEKSSEETVGGSMRDAVCSVWQAAQDVLAEKTHQLLQPGSSHSPHLHLGSSPEAPEGSPESAPVSSSNYVTPLPASKSTCASSASSSAASPSLSTFLLKTVKGAPQGHLLSPASNANSPWKALLQRHREARRMPLFGSTPYPSTAGGSVGKPVSETVARVGRRQGPSRAEAERKPASKTGGRGARGSARGAEEVGESVRPSGSEEGDGDRAGDGIDAQRRSESEDAGNDVVVLSLGQEDSEREKEREQPGEPTVLERDRDQADLLQEDLRSGSRDSCEGDVETERDSKGDAASCVTTQGRLENEDGEGATAENEEPPEEAEKVDQEESAASGGKRSEEGSHEEQQEAGEKEQEIREKSTAEA